MHSVKLAVLSLLGALALSFSALQSRAEEGFVVEFRLTKWKTVHIHDAKAAKTFLDTLKKLGCEAKEHGHDGHIDVTYRCPQWRALTVPTDEAAHKWESWLRRNGFETKHTH